MKKGDRAGTKCRDEAEICGDGATRQRRGVAASVTIPDNTAPFNRMSRGRRQKNLRLQTGRADVIDDYYEMFLSRVCDLKLALHIVQMHHAQRPVLQIREHCT